MGILRCGISALNSKELQSRLCRRLLGGLFGVSAAVTDAVRVQIDLYCKGFVVIGTTLTYQAVLQLALILLHKFLQQIFLKKALKAILREARFRQYPRKR